MGKKYGLLVTISNTLGSFVMTVSTSSIKLDNEIRSRVKRLAVARRRTPHWVMREAIIQYVEREEKDEIFRQSALAAWKAYQDTGLHSTAEEVDAWLEKLEAGEDSEAPLCHV